MGKPVTVDIPHSLGRIEARRRIEDGIGRLTDQLGAGAGALSKSWEGDRMRFSLTAMGQAISGLVDVADEVVRLEVVLPGFLAMIAGKVKGQIQKEGQVLLEDRRR